MARNPNDFLKSYHIKGRQVCAFKEAAPIGNLFYLFYITQMAVIDGKLVKQHFGYRREADRDREFELYTVHSAKRFVEVHTRWAAKA